MKINYAKWAFICAVVYFYSLNGQFTIENNSFLTVSTVTEIALNCDFINNGDIENEGTVYIQGNWFNITGNYYGDGKVIFNGSNQIIDHNNQSFYSLQFNTDYTFIENSLSIDHELILINGIITPDQNAKFLVKSNADVISKNNSSYINGTLYHEGTGLKFYPIGKEGYYRPVTLQNIQGIDPVVGLEAFNKNTLMQCSPDLNKVTSELCWQLKQLSGIYDSSRVIVELNYGITDLTGPLVLAQADSIEKSFIGIGNMNKNNQVIISESPLTENIFSVAEVNDFKIEIMNIITPNGDGVNDNLYIKNIEYYPDNKVIILNKAGTEIFSVNNYDNSWNTEINAKNLSQGDYICILKIHGISKVYKQMVSVIY